MQVKNLFYTQLLFCFGQNIPEGDEHFHHLFKIHEYFSEPLIVVQVLFCPFPPSHVISSGERKSTRRGEICLRGAHWADSSFRQRLTEQVSGLSGRAEQSVFWHKHQVKVLMEGCCEPIWPPVFWGWPPQALLCWSDFVLSWLCYELWVWIWQTDLKVSYAGSFQCPGGSNPPLIKEM